MGSEGTGSSRKEPWWARRRLSGDDSPHGDGGVTTAVGVVNNSVEGLIHPLPEHHGGGLPEETKTLLLLLMSLILGPR